MYIPIILGTARKGRKSENVAEYVLSLAVNSGMETELIDVADYRINATDNTEEIPQAKKWEEKAIKADGFIIVSPEYNHSYSGELKMFLDMLYGQYHKKPVALIGVSKGPFGGTRGIQALRLACIALGMHPLLEAAYFSLVDGLFDGKGIIKDKAYEKNINSLLESLITQAKALKSARK